ncbi:unnamed protein product [Lactuca virosa]|uniref:Uncharacterized protein n=1 Tax=Lactuca virosa TaxID=75947 RepID=A0AAU9PUI0_9ASTR|nr:unnamed protein product [Lactuca virosa]
MDPVFIQVDVHFQGIFAKYPIRYTGEITQRLSDIDFAGVDKNGCYEFIEMFTGERLIKEVETRHVDEDEDDHGAEDEDVDADEDDHGSPHFFKKDNGPDVDMGENAGMCEPLEEDMDDNEDVYPELPNIFYEKLLWKEQEPMLVGPQAEEVVRVNESEEVVRVNEVEEVARVNEDEELGRVNEVVGHVYSRGQPSKRKKSERILKLKLAKKVEGEGSSVGSPMDLD